MTKPRLAIGTYGSIAFTTTESGQVQAATRFRDEDGTVRRVRATGVSRSAADRALKARIATRRMHGEFDDITGDTSFAQLATMWLADIRDEGRLSLNTQSLYERDMRTLVMPAFEHLLLREITVRRVDTFLKTTCRNGSYSRRNRVLPRVEILCRDRRVQRTWLGQPVGHPLLLELAEVRLGRDIWNASSTADHFACRPSGISDRSSSRRPHCWKCRAASSSRVRVMDIRFGGARRS